MGDGKMKPIAFLIVLFFTYGCAANQKTSLSTPMAVKFIAVATDLRLSEDEIRSDYIEVKSPIFIRDESLVLKISQSLLSPSRVDYVPKLLVPERAVLLLAEDGSIIAGFRYSLAGATNDSFLRCSTKHEAGKYYLGPPLISAADDLLTSPTGSVIGYRSGRNIPNFSQMLEKYLDPYAMK